MDYQTFGVAGKFPSYVIEKVELIDKTVFK